MNQVLDEAWAVGVHHIMDSSFLVHVLKLIKAFIFPFFLNHNKLQITEAKYESAGKEHDCTIKKNAVLSSNTNLKYLHLLIISCTWNTLNVTLSDTKSSQKEGHINAYFEAHYKSMSPDKTIRNVGFKIKQLSSGFAAIRCRLPWGLYLLGFHFALQKRQGSIK